MAGKMNAWDPRKNDDYRFIDGVIAEYFDVSGVGVFVHKYLGVHDQGNAGDATRPSKSQSRRKNERQIQDMFFQENRDRHYDENRYEIKVIFNMQDLEFDIKQFAMFLESDTIYVEIHLNDCLEKLGRKMLSGDVIEMLHMRDDALLDDAAPAINKFYSVQDVSRSAGGWSATWRPHIIRVKLKPLTDSQEFADILDRESEDAPGFSVRDLISDFRDKMEVSDAIAEQAEAEVTYRNFDTRHLYVVPGDETKGQYPWIFAGDGVPPNSSVKAQSGKTFPTNPVEGDYFLNTGYEVAKLYEFKQGGWKFREVDLRLKWQSAHRILASFINNDNMTTVEGETQLERQALSKVVKPRAD